MTLVLHTHVSAKVKVKLIVSQIMDNVQQYKYSNKALVVYIKYLH